MCRRSSSSTSPARCSPQPDRRMRRGSSACAAARGLGAAIPRCARASPGSADRALPYLFPTLDRRAFASTLQEAVTVESPPPQQLARVVTSFDALAGLGTGFFAPKLGRRVCVILTDGESALHGSCCGLPARRRPVLGTGRARIATASRSRSTGRTTRRPPRLRSSGRLRARETWSAPRAAHGRAGRGPGFERRRAASRRRSRSPPTSRSPARCSCSSSCSGARACPAPGAPVRWSKHEVRGAELAPLRRPRALPGRWCRRGGCDGGLDSFRPDARQQPPLAADPDRPEQRRPHGPRLHRRPPPRRSRRAARAAVLSACDRRDALRDHQQQLRLHARRRHRQGQVGVQAPEQRPLRQLRRRRQPAASPTAAASSSRRRSTCSSSPCARATARWSGRSRSASSSRTPRRTTATADERADLRRRKLVMGAAGSEYGVRGYVMAFNTDLTPAWPNPYWTIRPSGSSGGGACGSSAAASSGRPSRSTPGRARSTSAPARGRRTSTTTSIQARTRAQTR